MCPDRMPVQERHTLLLIGGTGETAPLARRLARSGFRVLVSVATQVPLDVGDDPLIERRSGCLDMAGLERLITDRSVIAVVDASHPYAQEIRNNAARVCERLGIPYFSWIRPPAADAADLPIEYADDHEEAARKACSVGTPVLLTTGSGHLIPYVREAARAGVALVARVLDSADSIHACIEAGLLKDKIICGRGPFTVEENIEAIRRFGIGVLVTKDSGAAGGFPEKIAAAKSEACRVIVIRRPENTAAGTYESLSALIDAVSTAVGSS
ncbi:MAG: precorrin-6A reductase [Thermodesulfobacteriota bacterium]